MSGKFASMHNLHCASSLCMPKSRRLPATIPRYYSTTRPRRQNENPQAKETQNKSSENEEEQGSFSRKLSQMTEDAILEGGRSTRKNMEQAGFSDDLKKELEERIAATSFKSEYAAAHSIVNMPV